MDFWHIVLLGVIQGLTEFLPISSRRTYSSLRNCWANRARS